MSHHSIEPWKLTAFLLNELDAEEARQTETAVAADPQLQTEMTSLRDTIDRTRNVLASPIAEASLQPGQLAAIEKAIAASSSITDSTPEPEALADVLGSKAESNVKESASAPGSNCGTLSSNRSEVGLSRSGETTSSPTNAWKLLAALAACLLLAFFLLPAFNGTQFAGRPVDETQELKNKLSPTDISPLATSSGREAGGEPAAGLASDSKDKSAEEFSKSIVTESDLVGKRWLGFEQDAGGRPAGSAVGGTSELKEKRALSEEVLQERTASIQSDSAVDRLQRQASASAPASTPAPVVAGTVTNPAKPAEALVPQPAQRLNPSGTKEIVVAEGKDSPQLELLVEAPLETRLENQVAMGGLGGGTVAGTERMGVDLYYNLQDKAASAAPSPVQQDDVMKTVTPRIIIAEEEETVASRFALADPASSTPGFSPPVPAETLAIHDKRLFDDPFGASVDSKEIKDRLTLENELVPLKKSESSPTGDRFDRIIETPFVAAKDAPLSTFSIDVDTASYSKIRQYLMQANALPQPSSVRIEEMINYFDYGYAGPEGEHPFASHMAVGTCPWNEKHQLVRIGLQAKKIKVKDRPKANLVFLLDVSGSMDEPNKLPLVKQSIAMLARQLGENDRIAMVVYAGAAGCVLPSITGDHQTEILDALDKLQAGGSTNGGQGIELAYQIAREHFVPGGVNRVILCTDGDFNVGTTSTEGLVSLVENNAKSKVFLTVLGYGIGNYNDAMMEQITNRGNGTYGMVDSIREARRIMIEQLAGTLMTVAKDVKIQIEFNPAKVGKYRLIGYENRRLANEDFNNDAKDAGEIGAGHRVTALYEIVPTGVQDNVAPPVDDLRYGSKPKSATANAAETKPEPAVDASQASSPAKAEWLTLKLRYKQPEGDVSTKFESYLKDEDVERQKSDVDFKWASSVAEFGLLLRRSQLAPQADWEKMIRRAQDSAGDDAYRLECVEMMIKAKELRR